MIITVRDSFGTHVARCAGKTASCTVGRVQAAEAVARKVCGPTASFKLVQLSESSWRIQNASR